MATSVLNGRINGPNTVIMALSLGSATVFGSHFCRFFRAGAQPWRPPLRRCVCGAG